MLFSFLVVSFHNVGVSKAETLREQHEELIDDAGFCRVCNKNISKAARRTRDRHAHECYSGLILLEWQASYASAAAAALHHGQPCTSDLGHTVPGEPYAAA
eukprot:202922-Chlamydomonas_euryale.AAC.1